MRRINAAALFALFLLGCGEDEMPAEPGAAPVPLYPVPGCEAFDHTPCDVSTTACQSRLLELSACLRGDEPTALPPIETIDKAEYARRWREGLDSEPAPDPNHLEAAFVLLELIPPNGFDTEALLTASIDFVGGFYDNETQSITLVDGGQGLSRRDWSSLLLHEFIHFLQDREIPFAERRATLDSDDAWFAARAITEGEATLHQIRYVTSVSGFDPANLPLEAFFASRVLQHEADLVASDAPYVQAPYQFPYDWGGRFLSHAWRRAGLAGVKPHFLAPPRTTHTLLASASAEYVPDFEPTLLSPPEPPAEWTLAFEDNLGALTLFLALGQRFDSAERARALALAWRGDHFSVYAEADGTTTALVWLLDFADATSATSAAAAFSGSARADGTRVTIAKTNGPLDLEWAFERPRVAPRHAAIQLD